MEQLIGNIDFTVIDFTKLRVEVAFGEQKALNVAHDVGNAIIKVTPDIGAMDIARDIYYSTGAVKIPPHMVDHLRQCIAKSNLLAVAKVAVLRELNVNGKEVADR